MRISSATGEEHGIGSAASTVPNDQQEEQEVLGAGCWVLEIIPDRGSRQSQP